MDGGFLSDLGGVGTVVAVAAILVGIGVCFLGYRLTRFILALFGFVLGAALGSLLAGLLGVGGEMALVVGLLCGLVGAALSAAVYKLGVFLLGAAAGAVIGGMLGTGLGGNGQLVAVAVGALLAGLVSLVAQRVMIILATALSGSWLASRAAAALLTGHRMQWSDLVSSPFDLPLAGMGLAAFVAAWGLLTVAGALVQFRAKK